MTDPATTTCPNGHNATLVTPDAGRGPVYVCHKCNKNGYKFIVPSAAARSSDASILAQVNAHRRPFPVPHDGYGPSHKA